MKLRDALGISEERQHQLTRLMQVALVGVVVFGLVTLRLGLVVNAGVALAITFLPAVLRRDYRVPIDTGLALWITTAVFLHAMGALGLYTTFGWYDQVAHGFSAMVVAAAGYSAVRAVDLHSDAITIPPRFMFVFILVFILAFGVLWEILEFASGGIASILGRDALLTQYGASDIVYDLVFDAVGGVLVAAWGTVYLSDVARTLARRADTSSE